jgi:HAD superfamily hydrolase (TIGR01509 family)
MSQMLVIFDLDGTLVDSETLCNQAFIDLLPSISETVDQLVDQFRGKKLSEILHEIELKLSSPLPNNFEKNYRERVTELFTIELRPVDGVPEMLQAIEHPFCIASSGPTEKIKHALEITGLARFFGDKYFSSYTVGSWKPEPGLFLHTASEMGFSPSNCVVVEDSEVGIKATAAAGMHGLHYSPNFETSNSLHRFSHMSELPSILQGLKISDVYSA